MEFDIGITHSDFSLESWFASDTSSGYLEDAINGWDIWCKQHNLASYSQDQKKNQCLVNQKDLIPTISSNAAQLLKDHKKCTRNLSSSQDQVIKHDSPQRSCASRESNENLASNSRGQWKKIVYPFELVKPGGGVEGETTIKDINKQMMMSPLKPIPHLQDYVTHSCNNSTKSGYGISGKQVAALTRIQTKGRGSITIIRTKD